MSVEAAMRQIGRLHDVGDADAAEALGAKQGAGRIDDAFAIFGGFFPAHSHRAAQPCVRNGRLTIYMMIVINTQER